MYVNSSKKLNTKCQVVFKANCIQRNIVQYTFHVTDIGRSFNCETGCTGRRYSPPPSPFRQNFEPRATPLSSNTSQIFLIALWPARATTKISLAAPRYSLEDPVVWGFLRGVWVTKQSTYLLTYSMVQSPSWAANWFAASQEIPRILRNPKIHYRTHKRPPHVSILGKHPACECLLT